MSAVRASELSDESWTKIDTALGTPCRVRAKAYRFLSPSLVLARDGSCHDIDEAHDRVAVHRECQDCWAVLGIDRRSGELLGVWLIAIKDFMLNGR